MNILILDTETACGFDNPLVYDLGYIIADLKGNILLKRNYLIKNVFDNERLFETAYYKEKRPFYELLLSIEKIKKVYLGFAIYQLLKDIEKYNVADLYAYNSRFDFKSLNCTLKQFKNTSFDIDILDIMDYISIITNTIEYKEFCEQNGFLTKHRPPQNQKKAETLYRFLTDNADFTEDHTALSDSIIEYEILLASLKRKGYIE